jgi:hypothetical protein
MRKSIYLIIISILFTLSGYSQSVTKEETAAIQRSLYNFFIAHLDGSTQAIRNREKSPSEAFLCLLTIDSVGKINGVHFLGEAKYEDSAYQIFSKMQPSDFNDWKVEKCKGKTLVMPILILSRNSNASLFKDSGISAFLKAAEMGNLIIVRGFDIGWGSVRELPSSVAPVKKKNL